MLHIYILNTHLCTFWHKFSFLQGVLGKMGSIIEGWGLGAVSFPWMPCAEGEGCVTNNRAPPTHPAPKHFRSRLRLSALRGNLGQRRWNQRGVSAERRQAYRASKKSRTRGERGQTTLRHFLFGAKDRARVALSFIWRGEERELMDK